MGQFSRRDFLKGTTAAGLGFLGPREKPSRQDSSPIKTGKGPIIISTWNHGLAANEEAAKVLDSTGNPVEAAKRGVMVSEADPNVTSVGYGGWPNRDGVVQLDASIMRGKDLEAGAVAGIEGIKHPIAVASLVLSETPHVLLVGQGAQDFALDYGFKTENLLTPQAKEAWEKQSPLREDHDTIGMVVMAEDGTMAASCTTSGLAWKIPGRVGDSPLIAHGLYCDDEAGGAAATGIGEEVIKVAGSYQVVEFMRQGMEPNDAIKRVCERIIRRDTARPDRMVGFVAMRRDGKTGYGSTTGNFEAAVWENGKNTLKK